MAAAALAFSLSIPVSAAKTVAKHAAWNKLAGPVLSPANPGPQYKKHMVQATLEFFADVNVQMKYYAVMGLEREAIRLQGIMLGTKVRAGAKRVKVIKMFGFKNKKDMKAFLGLQDTRQHILFNEFSLNMKKM